MPETKKILKNTNTNTKFFLCIVYTIHKHKTVFVFCVHKTQNTNFFVFCVFYDFFRFSHSIVWWHKRTFILRLYFKNTNFKNIVFLALCTQKNCVHTRFVFYKIKPLNDFSFMSSYYWVAEMKKIVKNTKHKKNLCFVYTKHKKNFVFVYCVHNTQKKFCVCVF